MDFQYGNPHSNKESFLLVAFASCARRFCSCAFPCPAELLEEAQIVVEEQAQVVDAVAQHRQALHAHAEGITGVLLGIDTDRGEHIRMHHAAAQQLQPALAPAHVHIRAGLDEGEVGGAEQHFRIALEEQREEAQQVVLEIGQADVLRHVQSLDLMEHRAVGAIEVDAVDAAWADDADRRLALLHGADLHRAGMGAQQARTVERVEGVLHRPRRMRFGNIEGLEVVPVVLDFGALHAFEAHRIEDPLDAADGARHRMQGADFLAAAGQGDVDGFRGQLARQLGFVHRPRLAFQRRRQGLLDAVDLLAEGLALLRRHAAELLQQFGDAAFLAEQIDAQLFQHTRIGGAFDFGGGLAAQFFKISCHCLGNG